MEFYRMYGTGNMARFCAICFLRKHYSTEFNRTFSGYGFPVEFKKKFYIMYRILSTNPMSNVQ